MIALLSDKDWLHDYMNMFFPYTYDGGPQVFIFILHRLIEDSDWDDGAISHRGVHWHHQQLLASLFQQFGSSNGHRGHWKEAGSFFIILKFTCLYRTLKCRKSLTFNSEGEFTRVLASIGGHPALPQAFLFSAQVRDIKFSSAPVWVHDSTRGLQIHVFFFRSNCWDHFDFFQHFEKILVVKFSFSFFLNSVCLLSRKQRRNNNTETEHIT